MVDERKTKRIVYLIFTKPVILSDAKDGKPNSFPGDYSRLDPPDSISNSEVKRTRADDSVGVPM
jgi:hypothetical protein